MPATSKNTKPTSKPVKTVAKTLPTVTVFGKSKSGTVGTSQDYKARVDSTNRANLANDAKLRKSRGI